MAKLPNRNPIFRIFWAFDSLVSSSVFETWDALKRWGSAYSSFVYRFKITGPAPFPGRCRRRFCHLRDGFRLLPLAFALPPFSGTGDVWNKDREFAITFTDANGEIIGQRGIRQDDAIPLEEIPPH